jgi:two-component system response regulator YesN
VVRLILQRVERDYYKPLTLRAVASDMGMNAAYLSALFSSAVGVPFKKYLTELRLGKAKETLSQSPQSAAQVAFGVGYASEERFRSAFKKATGLSPRAWRETMDVSPMAPV